MDASGSVGILGATSLVGGPLVDRSLAAGRRVVAISRTPRASTSAAVAWRRPGDADVAGVVDWVTLCPLWGVPEWLPWLSRSGCRRIVAVSSMSLFSKAASRDPQDRAIAARLAAAEADLTRWTAAHGTALVLLRPTMVYDGVRDANVASIAAFIRRWGFFPLAGAASGLRQPVHAADVAAACAAALGGRPPQPAYALSGPVPLPFRELVGRIFAWLGRPPRMPSLPAPAFRAALAAAHALGRCRGVSSGVVGRMNEDLSCPHDRAAGDLGFRPRAFLRDVAPDVP